MPSKRSALLSLAVIALTATAAEAQVGVAARASTLGIGAELSYRVNRTVGLRAGGNFGSLTRTADIEGIEYDVKPKFSNGTAIVDLHPFGGSFHLSAGMVLNSNEGEVEARLNGPITIGQQTYQPDQVGELTGLIDYEKKTAPYLGLGFGGQGRISFLFDVGVVFSGHPRVGLTGGGNLTGQEKVIFDQNVEAEVAEIQAKIDDEKYLKYYPVVSLGIRIGF